MVCVIQVCWQLTSRIMTFRPDPVCTVKNFWWWTEELSEACRVLLQKQIWEISASGWFYYKNLSRCTVTWSSKKKIRTLMLLYSSDNYRRHILISSSLRFTSTFQVILWHRTFLIYLVTIIFRGQCKLKTSALCSCLNSPSITYRHYARCLFIILNEKRAGLVALTENTGGVWRVLVRRLEEKRVLGRPSVEGNIIQGHRKRWTGFETAIT